MEPFRITCETCRARLKIRSAEVIGEIHACPKCGGMVQVVPPPGWELNDTTPSCGQHELAGEPAVSLSATASVIFPAGALDDTAAMAAALETPATDVTALPAVDQPSGPVPAAAQVASPVLLWTAGGIIVAIVIGGLAWIAWPRGDKSNARLPQISAKNDSDHASEQSIVTDLAVRPTEPEQPKASDTESAAKKLNVADTTPGAKGEPVPAAVAAIPNANFENPQSQTLPVFTSTPALTKNDIGVPKDSPNVKPAQPAPAATASTPVAPDTAPAPKAAEPIAAAPDHSAVLKFDPLDFDPDRLGSIIKAASGPRASTSSIPDKAPGEVAIKGSGNVALPAAALADPGKQPAVANAVSPQVVNSPVSARRGPPADPPAHSTAQVLTVRVKAFQVTDMPLDRFTETISRMTGTGITLDPIALELVGIAPTATVSITAEEIPLQGILHDALSQRRLDIADVGGQLRVVLPKAEERHTIDYDVKDLAPGADAAEVGKLIERFIAPTSWKSAGGAGTMQINGKTLHIEQSDAIRRQVVIFCERLRKVRSLAVQGKYPVAMLSTESPYQRLSLKLSEPTTFTFLPWTRLDDVIRNWQELSSLKMLVDWTALAEVDLVPSSPIACSTLNRPWQESLTTSLQQIGLAWWAVDGETIQITTPSTLERIQRIEFYQVPQKLLASFASSEALVNSLQQELKESSSKYGNSVPVRMEADAQSGRLIVLASPNIHRQLSDRLRSVPAP